MAMKIDLSPKKYEAEIGDYGKFFVRPLGINEELEMQQLAREIDEDVAVESYHCI